MPAFDHLRICAEPVGKLPLGCLVCEQRGVSGTALPGAWWRVCSGCMNAGYRAGELVERKRHTMDGPLTQADRAAIVRLATRAHHGGDLVTVQHYVVTPEGAALEVVRPGGSN